MAHFYHHHQTAPAFAPPHRHYHPVGARAHPHPAPVAAPRYPRPRAAQAPAAQRQRQHAPARAHATAELDSALVHHSHSSNAPLEFDVSLPPSHILISHGSSRSSYSGLTPRHLSPPAVYPALPFMRIQCHYLPWAIDVYPDPHSGSGIVTVGDVLGAIYRALRLRVTESEWHAASVETQQHVRNAWVRRCKRQRSHDKRAYEESQGLRRVDWLTKNTEFQGLSPGKSRDHWVMHLRPGEKTVKFMAGS